MIIKQFLKSENVFFGLGEDGRIYRWSHSEGTWEPYWNIKPGTEALQDPFWKPVDHNKNSAR